MHLETIQHLRGLAGAYDDLVPIAKPLLLDLLDSYERHASPPVNKVNPVNPVPAPETFEAHGHTWTRHTPGDPCPVPPDARVLVFTSLSSNPTSRALPASVFKWEATTERGSSGEIIGWRYAEPQPSTPAK